MTTLPNDCTLWYSSNCSQPNHPCSNLVSRNTITSVTLCIHSYLYFPRIHVSESTVSATFHLYHRASVWIKRCRCCHSQGVEIRHRTLLGAPASQFSLRSCIWKVFGSCTRGITICWIKKFSRPGGDSCHWTLLALRVFIEKLDWRFHD